MVLRAARCADTSTRDARASFAGDPCVVTLRRPTSGEKPRHSPDAYSPVPVIARKVGEKGNAPLDSLACVESRVRPPDARACLLGTEACECVCTTLSQNARASLAHCDARLHAREQAKPRADLGSQNARASLAHRNARLHAREQAKPRADLGSQNARASLAHSKSPLQTHNRQSREQCTDPNRSLHLHPTPGHTDSVHDRSAKGGPLRGVRNPVRAQLGVGARLLGVQQTKHARRALRTEPGREENPQIQNSPPKAKSTPSNGGPARSGTRRSRPAAVKLKPCVVASAQSICKSRAAPKNAF